MLKVGCPRQIVNPKRQPFQVVAGSFRLDFVQITPPWLSWILTVPRLEDFDGLDQVHRPRHRRVTDDRLARFRPDCRCPIILVTILDFLAHQFRFARVIYDRQQIIRYPSGRPVVGIFI